jgi:hypothetical protein
VLGGKYIIGNTYTLASITGATFGTVTNNSITINNITATNTFKKVDILRSTTLVGPYVYKGNTSGNIYTDSSVLSSGITYYYSLLPYNMNDVSGHNIKGNLYYVGFKKTT